jgi:hypothetical protein
MKTKSVFEAKRSLAAIQSMAVIAIVAVMVLTGCSGKKEASSSNGTATSGGDPTVPGAILSFTATPGNGQVTLSWSTLFTATGYEVTRDNWANKETKTASQNSHVYMGLTNGTQYTFKVRGINAQGAGAENTATATPSIGELDQMLILPEGQAWRLQDDVFPDWYVFKSDGTYRFYGTTAFVFQTEGTWSTSGSTLTTTDYSGRYPYTYSISGDTLTMTTAFGDVRTYTKRAVP